MTELYTSNDLDAVVDNNILMDFYELGRLELLFGCFNILIIPRMIYTEEMLNEIKTILEKEDYDYEICDIRTDSGLKIYQTLTSDQTYKGLSHYDRIAIAIAGENLYYCSSNDLPVRKACEALNVKYTGTLGILGRCYVQGLLKFADLDTCLDMLCSDETSCYISETLIDKFKEDIKTHDVIKEVNP